MRYKPPVWADKFLQWYCRVDLLEEIQGDAYEIYYRQAKNNKRFADLMYCWNVIRFFRLKNIRKRKANSSYVNIFHFMIILKSYFRSGLRNITRHLTHSTINIAGLSLAIGCAISIFLLIDSFYNLDNFHKKGDRLFLLTSEVKSGDETETWARTPYLLGPALQNGQTGVESIVRIQRISDLSVRYNEHVFSENIWAVDSTFFDVFSYPILSGATKPLSDKKSIILSREKAIQYFGTRDAIDKELSIKFSSGEIITFRVSAIVDNLPDKASMHFGFLIPIEYWEEQKSDGIINWASWSRSTFVVMKEGHHPSSLEKSLAPYQKLQNEANTRFQVRDINFIPVSDMAAESYAIVDSLSWDLHPVTIIAVGTIAVFLLLLACFNYMNVAIASVSLRLKEIGIRKVIGSNKSQVILQYMVENLVLCAISLFTGVVLAYLFLVPAFNSLYPITIPFSFSSTSTMLWFFGSVLLGIALLSGAYPSLYVSSFNAISILKGKEKFGSKSLFSKGMLGFQFVISFTTIIFSLLSISNKDYFEKKDWGYDYHDVSYFPIHGKEQYLALSDLLSQQKNVIRFAGAASHIGVDDELTNVQGNDINFQATRFPIGFDYLETMNIRLKEGRFFNAATEADRYASVVVNEAFVRKIGWTDPVGQQITFHGMNFTVIGVAYNFYYEDFDKPLDPAILHIDTEESFNFFVVSSEQGSSDKIVKLVQSSWSSIAPDDPYLGATQKEVFASFYNSNKSDSKIMYFISMIALVLACMGLFGLISYNLSRRMKEFSIRKIFGANSFTIFRLMSQEYMIVIAFAFMMGTMLGYYLISALNVAVYPDHIPLKSWPVLATFILMLISLALTIISQLFRVVKENPVKTLRAD